MRCQRRGGVDSILKKGPGRNLQNHAKRNRRARLQPIAKAGLSPAGAVQKETPFRLSVHAPLKAVFQAEAGKETHNRIWRRRERLPRASLGRKTWREKKVYVPRLVH